MRILRAVVFLLLAFRALGDTASADTAGIVAGRLRITKISGETISLGANRRILICSASYCGRTTTDARGFFVFFNLPPDGYALSADRGIAEYAVTKLICVHANDYQVADARIISFSGSIDGMRPDVTWLSRAYAPSSYGVSACSSPYRIGDLWRYLPPPN